MSLESREFKTPNGRPATMFYRSGTSDYNTINACMTEDEYGLAQHRVTGLAVDIGSHLGGVAISIALDNPGARVVAVEAVPQNAELLRQNVAANGLGNVTVIENAAGGTEPVEMRFNYRGSESAVHHAWIGNSSLAYDSETLEHDAKIYDTPVTLSALTTQYGPIELLKIDCEGGEYAILADPVVKDIGTIVGEWHPVRKKTRMDILELLSGSHWVTFTGPVEGPGGFSAVRS